MAWILFIAMGLVAAAGLILPLVGRQDARRKMAGAVEVPTDEPADAPARPLSRRARGLLGLGMAAAVAVAAAGLYLIVGRPDLAAVSAAAPSTAARQSGPNLASLVPQLEARMRTSPNDPRGWRLLGWSYMRLGRYADAAGAYARAAALDPTNPEFPSARGEALTQAAGGRVTPVALAAFKAALARNGGDPRARYFLAVARDQGGDHAGAMADWVALLRSAPPGAPWTPDVRAFVTRIARARGEDFADQLASPTSAASGAAPAAAIAALPAAARRAAIAGMVERLAARLEANPHDLDGWIALMRARMVLGDAAAATSAYRDALTAFAGAPAEQKALRDAARALAVPGA